MANDPNDLTPGEPGAKVRPILAIQPYGPEFAQALEKLALNFRLQIIECANCGEAAEKAATLNGGLVVAYAGDRNELSKQVALFKALQREIRSRKIRALVVSPLRDHILLERLIFCGVTEIIPAPLSVKSLVFKLERHLRMMGDAKTTGEAGAVPEKSPDLESGRPAALPAAASARASVHWVDPLAELESDCWSFGKSPPRQIGGKWVARLRGPSPEDGRWVAIEPDEPDKQAKASQPDDAWVWTPTEPETDTFIKEAGAWVFRGQRPEYQSERWVFVAKRPELAFYYEGECYGLKIAADESGMLFIAKNSTHGENAWREIKTRKRSAVRENNGSKAISGGGKSARSAAASASTSQAEPASESVSAPALIAEGRKKNSQVVWTDPLVLESDCFLFGKKAPRYLANRWVAHLSGPGPAQGRWSKIENGEQEIGEEAWWVWTPENANVDPFIQEEGAWVCHGLAPKFQDECWVLAGRALTLGFFFEGECYGYKLRAGSDATRGDAIEAARDSQQAKRLLPLIHASLEKVIQQKSILTDDASPLRIEKQAGQKKRVDADDVTFAQAPQTGSLQDKRAESEEEAPGERRTGRIVPSISPLALAFLASELLAHRGVAVSSKVERFCASLKQAVDGIDFRLEPAGALDHLNEPRAPLAQAGRYYVPVWIDDGERQGERFLGAVSMPWGDAPRIPADYLQAVARIARGLLGSEAATARGVQAA